MASPTTSEQPMASLFQSVEAELERVDAWILQQLSAGPSVLKPLLDYVARFRGKRLRAAQVLLIGKACGSLTEDHIRVAGIIEMIHSATLVHDDLLDEAQERRKLDCLHVEWGAHTAVLLGDWIYSKAFAASTRMRDQTCSQVLSEATGRVCAGEMHQNLTRGLFSLPEQDYFAQIDGKTAALFEAGGRLAAHYSAADPAMCDAAARYGLLAGRAFQVVDDMLDLDGSETEVGKSLGTDWQRGKMTLPLIRLRDCLAPQDAAVLEELFQQGTDRKVLQQAPFAEAMQEAMQLCRAEVETMLAESTSQLGLLPQQAVASELAKLTHFLGARNF